MLWLLAQQAGRTTRDPNIFDTLGSVFSRADALTHPRSLVGMLEQMSIVWAVVLMVAGLVCLLNGYKFYRWVTLVLAAAIGAVAGYGLGQRVDAQYIVAACLAALLAVCAWPLMKYAVAVVGGVVGSFLGANVWAAMAGLVSAPHRAQVADTYWVGALIGLIICGMLSFVLARLSIVLFTSVSGATIALMGILALALQVPPWRQSIAGWSSTANVIVFPLLMIVPALIGLILQQVKPDGGGAAAAAKPAGGK